MRHALADIRLQVVKISADSERTSERPGIARSAMPGDTASRKPVQGKLCCVHKLCLGLPEVKSYSNRPIQMLSQVKICRPIIIRGTERY
jgi:hypothetical protein